MAGAPIGNRNRWEGSLVEGAIRRALAENEAKGRASLLNIAHKLLDDAEQGNLGAVNTLFDRLDGKAVAKTEVSGPDGGSIRHNVGISFIEPAGQGAGSVDS